MTLRPEMVVHIVLASCIIQPCFQRVLLPRLKKMEVWFMTLYKSRVWSLCLLSLILVLMMGAVSAQETSSVIARDAKVVKLSEVFKFTEGPVWHPDGYLLFSDIRDNTIYKWTPDGEIKKKNKNSCKTK